MQIFFFNVIILVHFNFNEILFYTIINKNVSSLQEKLKPIISYKN